MSGDISTIDEYIASFPADIQNLLEQIRATIIDMVPDAVEVISYKIAAFKLDGKILMYFAGWKDHVSIYPIPPGGDKAFEAELQTYRHGKGTARFPRERPLPRSLLERFVELHVVRIR